MRPRKIGFTDPGGMIEQAINKGREMALLDVKNAYLEVEQASKAGGVTNRWREAVNRYNKLIGVKN